MFKARVHQHIAPVLLKSAEELGDAASRIQHDRSLNSLTQINPCQMSQEFLRGIWPTEVMPDALGNAIRYIAHLTKDVNGQCQLVRCLLVSLPSRLRG